MSLVDPVGVVQFARSVHTEADEKIMIGKEPAPVVVEQGPVGLQRIQHLLAAAVLLLQFDHAAEKIKAEQGGFAALPGEGDFVAGLAGNVLPDVGLQRGIGHAEVFARRIHLLFFEVVAVGAIEVADRPDRLGHDVERKGMAGHDFLLLRSMRSSCPP